MTTSISIPALNLEFDTLHFWLMHVQVVHADAEQNPRSRAAAKNLQAHVHRRIRIVRTRIEHATLALRIELSERTIQRACELLESEGAPEKLLKAVRTLFDSLWVRVMRKNHRQKALKIKRIEENSARQSDSVRRCLEILGLENEPYLNLDPRGTHHTGRPDGGKNPPNLKSDPNPKYYSRRRAGAPATPQNLFFSQWMHATAESDQNVHSFCAAADRAGLKLPAGRAKLAKFSTWKEAKLQAPGDFKKWYNDANRATKSWGKPSEDIASGRCFPTIQPK